MRFLVAMTALSMATLPAQAQRVPCGPGAGLIAHLEKEWGEEPAVLALDAVGRMVRILANPETGHLVNSHHRPGWADLPDPTRLGVGADVSNR